MVALRVAAAALGTATLISTQTAAASPPTGVDATILWRTSADGMDYVFREPLIETGGRNRPERHVYPVVFQQRPKDMKLLLDLLEPL